VVVVGAVVTVVAGVTLIVVDEVAMVEVDPVPGVLAAPTVEVGPGCEIGRDGPAVRAVLWQAASSSSSVIAAVSAPGRLCNDLRIPPR
jgi:hypothetical protein